MKEDHNSIEFTGEFFVPGKVNERIEADHMERYKFACNFSNNKNVLDIACGAGYAGKMFIESGSIKYTGVDINENQINYAKSKYGSDKINYFVSDITSFNQNENYDLITCFETIEHVKNYKSAIQNLYKLLNSNGILLISSPNRPVTSPGCLTLDDKPANEFHTQEFIPSELTSLLSENGFSIEKQSLFGQRLRKKHIKNKYIRRISNLISGNPDIKSSAEVKVIGELIPRYFILKATKK